jgi:hypothetical protein
MDPERLFSCLSRIKTYFQNNMSKVTIIIYSNKIKYIYRPIYLIHFVYRNDLMV